MSEGWYNGLMIASATIATLGTLTSSLAYSFNINKITEIGKIKGSKLKGIKFTQKKEEGKFIGASNFIMDIFTKDTNSIGNLINGVRLEIVLEEELRGGQYG